MNNIKKFLQLLFAIIICQGAGFIGSFFTAPAIPNWYADLNKPVFNPPSWVFAPVWLALYTLMGISLYLVWRKKPINKPAIYLFLIHLIFNASWSIIFFGLQNIALALVNIFIILIMIIVLIWKFYPINKFSAVLLIPYLLWVGFASILNLSILLLN